MWGLLPLLAATILSYARGQRVMQKVTQTAESAMEKQVGAQLQAVRDLNRLRIEDYFRTTIKQCLNITRYPFLVNGSKELVDGVRKYRAEHNLGDAEVDRLRKELWLSYQNDFSRAYKEKTGAEPQGLSALFAKLDPEAVVLQHFYITANPNPIGAKFMKDTSLTTSHTCTYGRAHLSVHPAIRRFVESYGYGDFFLVDVESMRIIYSYAKEIDFGTSLGDGPFANNNLAEAVRQVIAKKNADDYVYSHYSLYLPSLDTRRASLPRGFLMGTS